MRYYYLIYLISILPILLPLCVAGKSLCALILSLLPSSP